MSLIDTEYINFLKNHFHLDWKGIHGAPHWARVRANGLLLAEQTGADTAVIEAFSFINSEQYPLRGCKRIGAADEYLSEYTLLY